MKLCEHACSIEFVIVLFWIITSPCNVRCRVIRSSNTEEPEEVPACYNYNKYKRLDRGRNFFSCKDIGNYKDFDSLRYYWSCEQNPEGGYIALRRSCPPGRIFNSELHSCVPKSDKRCGGNPIGSECEDKSEGRVSYVVVVTDETVCPETTPTPLCHTTSSCCPKETFKCTCEGVFPDPQCSTNFYICHKKKGCNSKCYFEKIKVSCPEGMSFDAKAGWCRPRCKQPCDNTAASDDECTSCCN